MKSAGPVLVVALHAILASAANAWAVTNDNGEVLINQAAALAGNVTPGDAPGFPVTISVPGAYRLTSGLTVTTFAHGIDVTAPEVSIDLGGNRIIGSGVGANGINVRMRAATIRNGTIRAFSQDGIRTIAPALRVEDMRIVGNQRFGIFADPTGGAQPADMRIFDSEIFDTSTTNVVCVYGCYIAGTRIRGGAKGIDSSYGQATLLGSEVSHVSTALAGNFAAGDNNIHTVTNYYIVGNLFSLSPNRCDAVAC